MLKHSHFWGMRVRFYFFSFIISFEEMMPILADTSSLEKQLEDADNKHGELMGNLRRCLDDLRECGNIK